MSLGLEGIKYDNTFGALLVGGLCATGLYGVTCSQIYKFFVQRFQDPAYLKWTILFLWVLDTFDAVLNGHFLYYYLVTNHADPTAMEKLVWSVIIHVVATCFSNFIVRGLYARRVFSLSGLVSSGNWPIVLLILIASSLDLVVGFVITVKAFTIQNFLQLHSLSNLFYLSFAAGTGSDVLLALSLCFYLWKCQTGFSRTDNLIQTLMKYTVNTSLLVALDALAGLVTYIIMPHNFIFLAFYLLLSKLYLNSYLAVLNARKSLRENLEEPVQLSQMSGPSIGKFFHRSRSSRQTVSGDKNLVDSMSASVSSLMNKKADDLNV